MAILIRQSLRARNIGAAAAKAIRQFRQLPQIDNEAVTR
jgi:hypothetical protein